MRCRLDHDMRPSSRRSSEEGSVARAPVKEALDFGSPVEVQRKEAVEVWRKDGTAQREACLLVGLFHDATGLALRIGHHH